MADGEAPAVKKKSDLPARAASAIVMATIAGIALWLGGWFWTGFVTLLGVGVFFEWVRLSLAIAQTLFSRARWLLVGLLYVGLACYTLIRARMPSGEGAGFEKESIVITSMILLSVIVVDVGAYFAGRAIGGPKIAPRISPSKTWAGWFGGVVGVFLLYVGAAFLIAATRGETGNVPYVKPLEAIPYFLLVSFLVATIAQAGDFFESWMKRKAGVKDSSNLIPGHGGLFDRTDGLLAVCLLIAGYSLLTLGELP